MRRSSRVVRRTWGAITVALILAVAAPSATPAAEGQIVKVGNLEAIPPKGAVENLLTGSLIVNPTARRGYLVFEMGDRLEWRLRAFDLDTLKPLGEVAFPDKLQVNNSGVATDYVYALDEERNLLYFPVQPPGTATTEHILVVDGTAMKVVKRMQRSTSSDPTAAVAVDPNALSDDDDPADVATPCTAQACLPSVPGVSPTVVGMEIVPPYLSGGNPKLLMLWKEPIPPTVESNANVPHVVQWDTITGRQDFIYEPRACTSRALPSSTTSQFQLAIFQARLGSGIYIGCNASGGTAQVVRITLDANGKPSAEETFPGPNNVGDVIADKEDDRLLFRVQNEEGESVWVFNGTASSYSGVVGISLSREATSIGLDPQTGRLYAQTPPSQSGNQRNPGGLLLSDIRRNPAPQALVFPELSGPGRNGIQVDPATHHLFVRRAGEDFYTIYRDDVPVTTDPPLTDLDRFTIDVEEEEGTTAANYTGTGHAYGFRTLLVNGAEAVPPGGPDVSSIRPIRFGIRYVGSPCLGGDRSIVLGSVQETQLSNNISNAAAAPAESDPGTITDLRQPGQRCYPKPRVETQAGDQDPFAPLYPYLPEGQYPRPLDVDSDKDGISDADERAGSDWQFSTAQCASDGNAKSRTTAKPLDRGDDIPKELRDQQVDLTGFRADVTCALEKRMATGSAEAGAIELTGLPTKGAPNVAPSAPPKEVTPRAPEPNQAGFIRIAESSSNVSVRKDPTLGLVAESIAFARGINIGDRIFIDAAYTYGLARAGGRPGTAATTFVRRLCGVRIPEFGIDVDAVDLDTDPQPVGDPVGDTGSTVFPNGIDVPPVLDPVPSRVALPPSPSKDAPLPPGIPVPKDTVPNRVDTPSQDVGEVDPANNDTDDQSLTDRYANDLCGDPGVQQAGSQPVLDAMNKALGSRGRVSAPTPDTELRQGSPGGYLASIQKDRLQQIGARSVQNDDSTQVPALEIVMFNDDPTKGRGRQVYQLAGVDASVTYGIYLLNPPTEDYPLPDQLIDITDDEGIIPPFTGGSDIGGDGNSRPRGPLGPIKILYEGVSFLMRSPKDALLAAAVWALLLAPVQLMLRRRALRQGA